MNSDNNLKSRISSSLYAVIFIMALLFEFYWITTDPYDYFMIMGIGAIAIIMGYLAFESIMINYNKVQRERYEQNEMIIKTQKAIYLATKKNNAANEAKSAQDFEAIKYMINRIVENQRELNDILSDGKYVQNRINTQNTGSGNITELIDKLSEANKNLANEVRAAVTVSELVKSNEEFVSNVRNILDKNTDNSVTDTVPESDTVSVMENISVEETDTVNAEITGSMAMDIIDDTLDIALDIDVSENHASALDSEDITDNTNIAEREEPAIPETVDEEPVITDETFDLDAVVDEALNNIVHSAISSDDISSDAISSDDISSDDD